MKKLLLTLLCLPFIGFGQILDTAYEIACDSYQIPDGNSYTVTQSGIYYWANCDGMGFSAEGYVAPTISTILGTAYPNGCTGNPLPEITE